MKKSWIVLAALFVMVMSVAAPVTAQDKIVIRAWTGSSSPVENDFKTAQVKAFMEANPDIQVDLLVAPDYGTQLQTAFASGDYPEVFTVGQFDFPTLVDSGVIADGSEQIEAQDDIYPGLKEAFSVDGKLYCAPKDFSTLALLYNKDLFDAAGVDYPTADWTWDDMQAAAEKLTSGDVVGASIAPDRNRWLAFFYGNDAQVFDADGNPTFNSPEAVASLDFYTGLVSSGFAKTPADLNSGWNGEAFGQGKAAMTVEGNWAIGYLNETFPNLKWGVAEVPKAPGAEAHSTLTFTECWAVGANVTGDKAEAAWKLVNFFTGVDGAKAVAEQGFGVMPARPSASQAWLDKVGADYQAFVTGADYAIAPIFPQGYADFTKIVDDGMNEVLAGSTTPQELLDEAQQTAQEIHDEMATPSS
jgi:multiple sugar transport system substrate-binding protein